MSMHSLCVDTSLANVGCLFSILLGQPASASLWFFLVAGIELWEAASGWFVGLAADFPRFDRC